MWELSRVAERCYSVGIRERAHVRGLDPSWLDCSSALTNSDASPSLETGRSGNGERRGMPASRERCGGNSRRLAFKEGGAGDRRAEGREAAQGRKEVSREADGARESGRAALREASPERCSRGETLRRRRADGSSVPKRKPVGERPRAVRRCPGCGSGDSQQAPRRAGRGLRGAPPAHHQARAQSQDRRGNAGPPSGGGPEGEPRRVGRGRG